MNCLKTKVYIPINHDERTQLYKINFKSLKDISVATKVVKEGEHHSTIDPIYNTDYLKLEHEFKYIRNQRIPFVRCTAKPTKKVVKLKKTDRGCIEVYRIQLWLDPFASVCIEMDRYGQSFLLAEIPYGDLGDRETAENILFMLFVKCTEGIERFSMLNEDSLSMGLFDF